MGLPPWVVENAESVRREAARYRAMTPAERARDLQAACKGAMQLLAGRPARAAILARLDALPASSKAILARLRSQARRGA